MTNKKLGEQFLGYTFSSLSYISIKEEKIPLSRLQRKISNSKKAEGLIADHHAIKIKINSKNKATRNLSTWTSKNVLLNNCGVKRSKWNLGSEGSSNTEGTPNKVLWDVANTTYRKLDSL